MTLQTSPHPPSSTTPPTGNVQPQQVHVSLALKAMGESRWSDAAKHVAAIPESPLSAYAWKMYLGGWLAAERQDFPSAEAALLHAVSAALVNCFSDEKQVAADVMLLAAAGLDRLGLVYRREERLDDAYHSHLAALRLRQEHGALDVQWESAMNLAVDCAVARRDDQAQRWCRAAIDLATHVTERPSARQAQSWSRLATVLTTLGRHDDAVAAARTARECWRKHDSSAVTAPHANVDLAGALMRYAESVYEIDGPQAGRLLHEAVEFLDAAADELPPFGAEAASDVRRCTELTDFARRLLASLND